MENVEKKVIRTTVNLPREVHEQVDDWVKKLRYSSAKTSIDATIVRAVEFWLAAGAPRELSGEALEEIRHIAVGEKQQAARKSQPAKQKSSKLG